MYRRRNSSVTTRDELVGQKVKSIIPDGFAERLIADDLRSVERRAGAADWYWD